MGWFSLASNCFVYSAQLFALGEQSPQCVNNTKLALILSAQCDLEVAWSSLEVRL